MVVAMYFHKKTWQSMRCLKDPNHKESNATFLVIKPAFLDFLDGGNCSSECSEHRLPAFSALASHGARVNNLKIWATQHYWLGA